MDTVVDPEGVMHDKYTVAGDDTNNRWDDGAGGRVTYFGICYGSDSIYSIQTTYLRQGTQLVSRKHGGTRGNLFRVKLREPLTWVSGHYDTVCLDPELIVDEEECPWNFMKVITSLKFGTGQTTYGPFGKEVGTPFSFDSGTEITGFHGNSSDGSGGFLHAIGVYARCPATCFLDDPPVSVVKKFSSPETASCSEFSEDSK